MRPLPAAGNSPSPFLGSGTTLAAAEATQRVCYGIVAMRVCGRFPNTPLRARQLYWGWSTFAPRPDGGVLALSFVTALIARPWKVGVRVRITCGNVPGAPPYSWQKLAECELDCSGTIDARFCAWRTPGWVKSVNLCELSVPGTEARCRPSHYRLSDDPQLRTGARKNCTTADTSLPSLRQPLPPAPPGFAGGGEKRELM